MKEKKNQWLLGTKSGEGLATMEHKENFTSVENVPYFVSMGVYICQTHQTLTCKWVHLIICKLCLKKSWF